MCERYLDLTTTTVVEVSAYSLLDYDMGIRGWFLCSELMQQLISPFLAPEWC